MKGYESTHLHSTTHQRRTEAAPGRIAFVIGFCAASLPDPAGLSAPRTRQSHCQAAWVRRPDRAQCDQRLQPEGPGCAQKGLLSPLSASHHHCRRSVATPARPFTPQPARIWPRSQSLEFASGGKDLFRARTGGSPNHRSECASCRGAVGGQVETRQTLDHQSRSLLSPKKTARDRLIDYASSRPDWAIGFLDEVWWSRFALPQLHAWQDQDDPVRLVKQTWQKGDPDPKALAWYGVLWQQGSAVHPLRKQLWLRFVTRRPVSAITTQFLEWCCTCLQAQGKTSWLLSLSITPPGITASRYVPGCGNTTARSSEMAKAFAFCPSFSPRRVPGSTLPCPNGSMPNAMWSSKMRGFLPNSLPSGSVLILDVPMNRIWLFPKRCRNYALSTITELLRDASCSSRAQDATKFS
jgi:hypothetical protein